ncbi:hypothetical protein DFH09DRAFT_1166527 [Mycena vulgaris]|nr:hypothetical protein DFH09DRAFT_1166527 [Mycena vulgaris]
MHPEGYDPDWDRERNHKALRVDSATLASLNGSSELGKPMPTREDELLATRLAANVDLMEALKLYDLKRVAFEPELSRRCKIGLQNAQLLSQALATASPEDLTNRLIADAHKKCVNSQELISTQIPWASAAAERSRETHRNLNTLDSVPLNAQNDNEGASDLGRPMATREEELLEELLTANAELIAVLKRYEDLDRVAFERALQRH